jgi:CheY-like chemotaxis protein
LRDFDALRHNPLCALFGVSDRLDAPAALQRLLVEAIEALEPDDSEPAHARSWRIYDLLFYRYVQQLSQQEVADQLGIGVRHERRERAAALETLAYHLWAQHGLEEKAHQLAGVGVEEEYSPAGAADLNAELAWLRSAPLQEPTDLAEALSATLTLVQPLAAQRRVTLEATLPDRLPGVAVHPVALNELLLNVLTVAIHQASGGRVRVSVECSAVDVQARIYGTSGSGLQPRSQDDAASLDIVHRLADLAGGRLFLTADGPGFDAALTVPLFEQVPVLALDDNVDTLRLLERYTVGTRYRLHSTTDPAQVLALAEKLSPGIIVLDLMMPQIDGWQLLGQLREHPSTRHIPIVVCTILAQQELALTLGASGFVKKPIKRPVFLAALDRASQAERRSG